MKKRIFKKKRLKVRLTRQHKKVVLKHSLYALPLLLSGFVKGLYADNNLWDLLNPQVGGVYTHWVKGRQYCSWIEFAGCLRTVWGANHRGYDAGNASNYLSSENYKAISVGNGNEAGIYNLSGFTNYVGGNLTINLGNGATLKLSGSNSFTSYQGSQHGNGKDDVSFNVGTLDLSGTLEVGNRVGTGAGTHTGIANLNMNASHITLNGTIKAFKTSGVTFGKDASSNIAISSATLDGDTCSSLARVGVGANCSSIGPTYIFKGATNATNTTFNNGGGSFNFENNAHFSGAKFNGGTYTFKQDFNAANNTAFNSGSFTFQGTSSFDNATFSNLTYTFSHQATFQNSTFNGGTFTFNNTNTQHPQATFENSSFSNNNSIALNGHVIFQQAFNNQNHNLAIQNATFENATFDNTGKITISHGVSFNNTSFNTSINSQNTTINGNVTFSGKNELKNGATLNFGNAQVTLNQGTSFNITSLGSGSSVTILNSSGGITYNNLLNNAVSGLTNALKVSEQATKISTQSFTKGLWDIITYNGVTGHLLTENTPQQKSAASTTTPTESSPQVYNVSYKIGDKIYKLQETFSHNSITIQALESGTYTPPPVVNGSKFNLSSSTYINSNMPWYDHKFYMPKSQNFTENGTYYLPSIQVWGSYNNTFKQTFSASNSNLVIGNSSTWTGHNVNSSDTVSFGDTSGDALNGHCGPWPYYQCAGTTTGTYSAYNVYITANLRSGNRVGTGGAANLIFNGVNSINIANAKITQNNAGAYSSSMTFSTDNMDSDGNIQQSLNDNGKLSVYGTTFTNHAKNGTFTFNVGQATFENTNFNGGTYNFKGNSLNFESNNQFNSGSFNISTQNTSFNNANFSSNASFNFSNPSGTTSFKGNFTNANQHIQMAGSGVFGNTTDSNKSSAKTQNGTQAIFNNTGSINIQGDASFNNVTFDSPTNMGVKGKVTLNNITLKNLNNPLSFGNGTITFGTNSTININQAISNGNPITIISSSKNIDYNNAFAKNLWKIINYQGHGASSEKVVSSSSLGNGLGVYDVTYTIDNQTYNFQETFSQNSISIRRLGVDMVFYHENMEDPKHVDFQNILGFMTYIPKSYNNNLGNHQNDVIYYYDKSINFYTSSAKSFSQIFTGQNSAIVFGAKQLWTNASDAPQSDVVIRFGDNKGAGSNDASGHCWNLQCVGFITGHYEAQKIYITGSIESGNRVSSGGGANLNFKGLQGIILTNATLYNRSAGTGLLGVSQMNFSSNANIQAQNSHFIDNTAQNGGKPNFSFTSSNMDFSNSSFRGYVGATQSIFKFNATNTINFTDSTNLSSGLYQINATNQVVFDNSNLSVSVGTSTIAANQINFNQNASISASNHSTLEIKGSLNMNDTSSLDLNQSTINVSSNATLNDKASLIVNNSSHINFNGETTFNSPELSVNLNNNSSIVFNKAVSLGGQFNFSNHSSLDFKNSGTIATNTAFNFYDNAFSNSQSPITFNQALNVHARLSLGGNLLNANNNQSVLNLGNSNLTFNNQGNLNIANIDLLSNLSDNKERVYSIVKANISNNTWYNHINFFGMQISDGVYDATNQTYSFTNPLNNALKITESFKNNQLSVTLSQIPGINNTLYNIAPEIFNYQKTYTNKNGVYSYSDNAQGTFYLTSNIKGYYYPSSNHASAPTIPQTYNAQGNPIEALHIFNKGYDLNNLKALGKMALGLYPKIKGILGGKLSLSSLSDSQGEKLNELENLITPSDWKNINEFISNANNSVVQNFNNGSLIVGATKIGQTNTNSAIWFGGLGYEKPCNHTDIVCQKFRNTYLGQLLESSSATLGYINTTFNAKEIYLTGTLGSGNAWGTGGSASVTFNSATSLSLNKANIISSQTDGIFSMLGQDGINKVFNQAGLANILGEVAKQSMTNAGGLGNLIAEMLGSSSVIGKTLSEKEKGESLNQLLGKQNFENLMNHSGLNQVIKDLIKQKLGFWTGLVGGLAGIGGIDLQNPEKMIGGMSINELLSKKNLFNQITGYISANDIGQVISVVLQDVVNPSNALKNDAITLGEKMIGEFLGQDTLNSIKSLLQNQQVKGVLDKVLSAKGLGLIYEKGLGDLMPSLGNKGLFAPYGLSQVWQKGDFNFNAQGVIFVQNSSFSNANGGTLSFNAGSSLVFAGNNRMEFSKHLGTLNLLSHQVSNIDITTLNASNGLNINATNNNVSVSQGNIFVNASCVSETPKNSITSNASSPTNSCELISPTHSSQNDTSSNHNTQIVLNNNDESLSVTANNFNFSGNIYANGMVDFSKIKGSSSIKNLYLYNNASFQGNHLIISQKASLSENASFTTNDLNIQGEFNNNTTHKIGVRNHLTIAQNASLSTGIYGIEVGGSLNNLGAIHFNLANSQNPTMPLIQVGGVVNLNTTHAPFINITNSVANDTTYTLLKSNRYINYNINPNSLQSYLKLYTLININGHHIEEKNGVLTYLGQQVQLQDKGLLLSVALEPALNKDSVTQETPTKNTIKNNILSLSILYNQIKMSYGHKIMDFIPPTLQDYIVGIQGKNALTQIETIGGSGVIRWLSKLMIESKENPLFAPIYLQNHSLNEVLNVARDLENTMSLISNPSFRNNATRLLEIASYTQQTSRLTKLSNFRAEVEPNLFERLLELKNKRFSDANPNALDFILKYTERDKHKNNVWVQGVGGASFVAGGNGTLYGLNVGYDRFIKNVILGGYVAYGYSGFNGRIMSSLSNNVNVGMYARAFVKRSEITLSANETYGSNTTTIDSHNALLSVLNQHYNYNTWTTSLNGNYGYDFIFKHKSVILKPQVGLSYYFMGLSGIKGKMNNLAYQQFATDANPTNKSILTLNVGLESRQYFGKNSYYFVTAKLGRDILVHSKGDKVVRFMGENTLLYRKGGAFNTFASLVTGGEMRLWRLAYVNAGVGLRFGLQYQDINVTGNVGMRVVF
ncbi:vacuolating cytotoxin domain-containing protein [Helicobacter cetorum]|uniref:Toxin-like outer membrane protein n=1 Tax=Helicobacter cetorum (strain ATCC BAA-540 / CCUG 52418 / MIT 99-5656) TaxID=1163745 RepID=I0ERA5_HELCM|nr:vacuolating cytotoxin domain-containing protein [Helicobacter cetorum]AFI05474.1 toxin-like outer membrane protein [Helicobacter cetorum MIT 99-5656]